MSQNALRRMGCNEARQYFGEKVRAVRMLVGVFACFQCVGGCVSFERVRLRPCVLLDFRKLLDS